MDAEIQSFVDITGASPAVARSLLEMHDGDLQTAVSLFLASSEDMAGIDVGSPPPKTSTSRGNTKRTSRSKKKDHQDYPDEDGVRAPIASTQGVLSADPAGDALLARQFRAHRRGAFDTKNPPPVFDMLREEGLRDYRLEGQILEGKMKNDKKNAEKVDEEKKLQRLADIFRPPLELLFKEDFDQAKEAGTRDNRWIIVNIQDSTEFASQKLNRDTWSDPELRQLIKRQFLLWQRLKDTPEALRFMRFYPQQTEGLPHISIIDPRTGEMLWHHTSFISAEELRKELRTFLDKHFFDPLPTPQKKLIDLSEDEQLMAAINASLHAEPSASTDETQSKSTKRKIVQNEPTPSDDGSQQEITPSSNAEDTKRKRIDPQPSSQPSQKKDSNKSDVPSKGRSLADGETQSQDECALMIRETNGNTLRVAFPVSSTIGEVYDWVSSHRTDGDHAFQFVTPFPRRTFDRSNHDMTLTDAQLTPRSLLHVSAL
eukprot:TRINITY_DN5316_c0_g1_i1.p1 TRINITY_DN5316_c0_g1~~TRINITY_DN5316_c0_g1_i1.p1  ORF type:complete len:493 (-),score=111.19 TRINITY_DN5316_c0_g1_i1:50-1504(-)